MFMKGKSLIYFFRTTFLNLITVRVVTMTNPTVSLLPSPLPPVSSLAPCCFLLPPSPVSCRLLPACLICAPSLGHPYLCCPLLAATTSARSVNGTCY